MTEAWSQQRARLYHYRTKDKVEVDAVIETPDARVVGIEVKAGVTVRTGDLSGLRNLANVLGERFVAGIVLYTGQQTLPFGEKIRALPARRPVAPRARHVTTSITRSGTGSNPTPARSGSPRAPHDRRQ